MASIVSRITPVSGTAGASIRRGWTEIVRRSLPLARAFATKLVLLLAIFVAVPWILYGQFRAADEDKQSLLLKAAQEQGRLVAESIKPHLSEFTPKAISEVAAVLSRIGGEETNIKVLYRPVEATKTNGFYYVASAPKVSASYLASEQEELIQTGIFNSVPATCERIDSTAARYRNPKGKEELLVSMRAVNTGAGCWVVITSTAAADFLETGIGRPYWQTPEIRFAAMIYLLMAVFVVLLFLDGRRNLQRFATLARRIRTRKRDNTTFAEENHIPELGGVAIEFDRMVGALRHSAQMIRYMAEDNAHAFKTPIAVIAQAVEPLKRSSDTRDGRAQRAIEIIEHSVQRLDNLVSIARRMDEASAEIIDPTCEPVEISVLCRKMAEEYTTALVSKELSISVEVDQPVVVLAQEDSLETVLDNLLENAASFSSKGQSIHISIAKENGNGVITLEDSGPGIDESDLDRVFDRYFTKRSSDEACAQNQHFGVGLWIVRRNIEAIGGTVYAGNRPEGGLRITMKLPLA